jgi:hypothetical protein
MFFTRIWTWICSQMRRTRGFICYESKEDQQRCDEFMHQYQRDD